MEYLRHKGYHGSVEYSEEDKCFFGKILGLSNSLILYEGYSLDELKEDFMVGVEGYLDRCTMKGIEPEKTYNSVLNIQIPFEIHIRATSYAEKQGTSIDAFVCDLIEKQLESAC